MTEERTKKIRPGCEIALSAITVALAAVFIAQVADIYYSGTAAGGDIYSREIVWNRLQYLIAPVCVWAYAVITCFFLSVALPYGPKKPAGFSPLDRARRLRRCWPKSGDEQYSAARREYNKYRIGRYAAYAVASGFALGVAIYTVIYISDKSNFSSGVINTDVLALVRNVFPLIISSFVVFVLALVYEYAVAKRELSSVTRLLVAAKTAELSYSPLSVWMMSNKQIVELQNKKAELSPVVALMADIRVWTGRIVNSTLFLWIVRAAVFTVAVVFIGVGIANGGADDVWKKAVNICTECIGLG